MILNHLLNLFIYNTIMSDLLNTYATDFDKWLFKIDFLFQHLNVRIQFTVLQKTYFITYIEYLIETT